MIKKIKEKMTELNVHMDPDRDDAALHGYIMYKAKIELDGKAGAVEDEVVYGWARHFYEESEEVIEKECQDIFRPTPEPIKKENTFVAAYKADKKKEAPQGGQIQFEL